MAELHDLTALQAAAAIRARTVSPTELVDHYLDRIERLDGEIGAFVTVTADSARQQARQAEAAVLSGAELPPLHGVPIAIKDLNLTAGVPTKLGSRLYQDFLAPVDDHVVRLLREAGTISLGKTATPEFGLPCYTETDIGPPARTPWDTARLAGGSSGGAAAAVAAGFLPIAQGSDGGGSIRIPASVTGLFGIKPCPRPDLRAAHWTPTRPDCRCSARWPGRCATRRPSSTRPPFRSPATRTGHRRCRPARASSAGATGCRSGCGSGATCNRRCPARRSTRNAGRRGRTPAGCWPNSATRWSTSSCRSHRW